MRKHEHQNAHSVTVPATETAADDSEGLVPKPVIARAASVSSRTIDNWVRERKIPAVKISARCIRFSVPAVLRALQRFEIKEATR
jgi:hypothetical protein